MNNLMSRPVTYERWSMDSRFFWVFFSSWDNEFKNNSAGPCLAITDDFGNLVPTGY